MIFNSFNFIVLFPLIFLLYYAIPAKYQKARNLFLLAVSYLLYMQWKPVYALILLSVTAITYYSALTLSKSKYPKRIVTAGVLKVMTKVKMSDCVREAFAPRYQPYLDIAERGAKQPSKKRNRMMTVLGSFLDGEY